MAKSAAELNGMLIEEIEEYGKKIHQLAEEYETACKAGDGFEAHVAIGQLRNMQFMLRVMATRCHEMNQPDASFVEMKHSDGSVIGTFAKDRDHDS